MGQNIAGRSIFAKLHPSLKVMVRMPRRLPTKLKDTVINQFNAKFDSQTRMEQNDIIINTRFNESQKQLIHHSTRAF